MSTSQPTPVRGRFAPSPSGRMHLGNLCCALLAWLSVRSQNGEMLLRIEDLDPDRCTREKAELLMDDLTWLASLGTKAPAMSAPMPLTAKARAASYTNRR